MNKYIMRLNNRIKPLRVVFILTPNMLATSMTLPTELLLAAHTFNRKNMRTRLPIGINIVSASESGQPVKTHTGITLTPDIHIDALKEADIIYLPALWRNPQTVIKNSPKIIQKISHCYDKGAKIAAVGTGCCFLAQAGLLDNKPATTHWYYFDQFAKHYPKVNLKRDLFITQAGMLYCTGSVNALAELTVTFISDYFDDFIAGAVQRHFFHAIRYGLTTHAHRFDEVTHHSDEQIMQVQAWINDNHSSDLSLTTIAKQFDMSNRTLSRRFKYATGTTVNHYVQTARMNMAKELIEKTNLSLSEVIEQVGYQDATHFNHLFKQRIGFAPKDYKNTVRAKVFDMTPSHYDYE